jgi:hypothetical protein
MRSLSNLTGAGTPAWLAVMAIILPAEGDLDVVEPGELTFGDDAEMGVVADTD